MTLNCHAQTVARGIKSCRVQYTDNVKRPIGNGKQPLEIEFLASAWEPEALSNLSGAKKRGPRRRKMQELDRQILSKTSGLPNGKQMRLTVPMVSRSEQSDVWQQRFALNTTPQATSNEVDPALLLSQLSLQRRVGVTGICIFPNEPMQLKADRLVLFGNHAQPKSDKSRIDAKIVGRQHPERVIKQDFVFSEHDKSSRVGGTELTDRVESHIKHERRESCGEHPPRV